MNMKKIKEVLEKLKELTKETAKTVIPELLVLVPIVGPALKEGSKTVIEQLEKTETIENVEPDEADLQDAIAEVKNRDFTEEEIDSFKKLIVAALGSQIVAHTTTQEFTPVYCNGFVVLPDEGDSIPEYLRDLYESILLGNEESEDDEDQDDEYQSAINGIRSFADQHIFSGEGTYSIRAGQLVFYLDWDDFDFCGRDYLNNDSTPGQIIEFIHNLNIIAAAESLPSPYLTRYKLF